MSYINDFFLTGIFGLSYLQIALLVVLFFISISLRTIFAKFLARRIQSIVKKINPKSNEETLDILINPLKLIPIILIFIILSLLVDQPAKISNFLDKINQSLITIFIFWLFLSCFSFFTNFFSKLEKIFSKEISVWFYAGFKYIIVFLGVVAILEIWGIRIGPIIAGLGLFGVAVALGAQDLFKNLISGILILAEKRFRTGDVISLPSYGDGVVEQIGFRSTTIRKFDSTPLTIPNYIFADSAISNYSKRHFRRINIVIGLEYSSDSIQLKNITDSIRDYIINSKNFIVDEQRQCFVKLEKFNDSSIDILVLCFTSTKDWDQFLQIREDLLYEIKIIVKNNNSSFAFPSNKLYFDKDDLNYFKKN